MSLSTADKARMLMDSLESWGECDLITRHFHAPIWQEIEKLFNPLKSVQHEINYWNQIRNISYYAVMDRFNPAPAESDPRLLGIYKSKEHKDSERRTIGKPHKMIKHILPYLTDAECLAFAQWYRDSVQVDSDTLTLEIGETRADFKRVYTADAMPGDALCTNGRKSLTASCMRYAFDNLPAHPCEVYASGDFQIAYVKDNRNRIGARVIVRPENKSHAPVYVSHNAAGDKLESWLRDNQYSMADNRAFNGARLLYIANGNDSVVGPYLDICRDVEIDSHNQEITISRNGSTSFSATHGSYDINPCVCDDCGESMSEDDSIYVESCECTICESCFNQNYFRCEGNGEIYHDRESVSVYYARNRFNTYSQAYVDSASDIVYVESDSEYWDTDCVIWVESESEYYLTDDIGDKIFQSDFDSEYYLTEYRVELSNGQFWTRDQVIESGQFNIAKEIIGKVTVKESDGIRIEKDIYKEIAYLKDYLEYDANGEIINRQIELPLAA